MDPNVKAFVDVAKRASVSRWPAVRCPAVEPRIIGKHITWPTRRRPLPASLEYVDNAGMDIYIGHPGIIRQIDPEAAAEAEAECRQFIQRVEEELALVRETDPNYIALKHEAEAMLLVGSLSQKAATVLGDRFPLAPCVYLVEQITRRVWPGRQVRHLVDAVLGEHIIGAPLTVEIATTHSGLVGGVAIVIFGLRLLFRLWNHGWNGNASIALVVGGEETKGWHDISRAIASFCPSPSDAVALKHALATILEILEERPS